MPDDQLGEMVLVWGFLLQVGCADTLGQGRIGSGCRSSLRPAGVGMERCGGNTRGPIKLATTPGRGSDSAAAARVLRPGCSRRPGTVERADMSVAQPVVDQGEQFACRGDLGDVLAAA